MYTIIEKIVYRTYGAYTYVKSLAEKKEFLFGSVIGDVLEYLRTQPGANIQQLTQYIESIYDESGLETDMRECLELLQFNGIVKEETEAPVHEDETVNDQVADYCARNHILHTATLELTYRCSERCVHCYLGSRAVEKTRRELTTMEWIDIIDQLADMGCLKVLFTGGEVCLRPDLCQLVRHAVERDLLVDIFTNGISMTQTQFNELCDLPLNSISFSLYAADPSVHDAITRVPGSFHKTLNRMLQVKAAGIDAYAKTVTIRQNQGELERLMDLGKQLHFDVLNGVVITPIRDKRETRDCRVHNAQVYQSCFESEYNRDPYPVKTGARDIESPICNCGRNMISINPYGDVYPCVSMPLTIGDVHKESLEQIWHNSPALKDILSKRFCDLLCQFETCEYRDQCTICMGNVFEEGHGELIPSHENCLIAEGRTKFVQEHLGNAWK